MREPADHDGRDRHCFSAQTSAASGDQGYFGVDLVFHVRVQGEDILGKGTGGINR